MDKNTSKSFNVMRYLREQQKKGVVPSREEVFNELLAREDFKLYGWFGKALRVNLSSGNITEEEINEKDLENWIGGRGLGSLTIAREVRADCDPLSSENKLVFAAGPLTGSKVSGSGRFSASAKSPLTGTIFDSNSGGTWGVRLKKCGCDMLIVEGRSGVPVYLAVNDGRVHIHEAESLWGTDVAYTVNKLQDLHGKDVSVACIGPAGENLVKFASIMIDGFRALGRGGLGAVMGSKNLKAIAVRGNNKINAKNPGKLDFVIYETDKWIKANPITSKGLPEFGTPVLVNLINEMGVFPSHNFQFSQFPGAAQISGEVIARDMYAGRQGCHRCPVLCGRKVKTQKGVAKGPEYESIWALGPECGIGDIGVINEANELCNRLGLDTISTGVTIGCSMELEEKGLLKTGLVFGDQKGLLEAIRETAYREGRGALLAEGSRNLAEKYNSGKYAMQVKGLELPAYDPRGLQGMGLGFATSNRGGCHLRSYMIGPEALGVPKMVDRFSTGGKAGLVINQQNITAVVDSLVMCLFINLAVSEEYFARILSAVTGVNYQPQDLHVTGERIWNLERLFNLSAGIDSTFDTLPQRLLEEPVRDGPSKGGVVELEPMLKEYYRFRGWDESGVPSVKKIKELGLEEFQCWRPFRK